MNLKVKSKVEPWSWSLNLKFEIEILIWSFDLKFEFEVWIWSLNLKYGFKVWIWILNLKFEFEVVDIWFWKNLKLKRFEVRNSCCRTVVWSLSLTLMFEFEGKIQSSTKILKF